MTYEELKRKVLAAASRCARQGAGYSQQRAVLDEVAGEFGGGLYSRLELSTQQEILTCWHDLFREGALSWGYDLDNPDSPFFHVPERGGGQGKPRR